MHLDDLEKRLLATARADTPSDRVPYTFEKRVMAQILARPQVELASRWAHALWRAAAPCLGIAILLTAYTGFNPDTQTVGSDFSEDFENTVLAAADLDTATETTADFTW